MVESVGCDHIEKDTNEPTAGVVVKSDILCKFWEEVVLIDRKHPRGTIDETIVVECKSSRSADVVVSKVEVVDSLVWTEKGAWAAPGSKEVAEVVKESPDWAEISQKHVESSLEIPCRKPSERLFARGKEYR